LYRFLRKKDAEAAGRIHANDHQKLMRAIEMAGLGQEPRQGLEGFRVLKIGIVPDRAALYEKLNRRCEWMFLNGLLEETERVLAQGVPDSAKALGTLGYRQAVKVLREGMSVTDAVAECQLKTRHYAKRQMTWFRAEAGVQWLRGFGGDERVQEEAAGMVKGFLKS
jgi:tRNA dimethylallyltransferase